MAWVNIWVDPEGARFVTGYRDGNETVPTAVTGSGRLIEADAATIKAHLARAGRPAGEADRGAEPPGG